jgi:hypothetical protein
MSRRYCFTQDIHSKRAKMLQDLIFNFAVLYLPTWSWPKRRRWRRGQRRPGPCRSSRRCAGPSRGSAAQCPPRQARRLRPGAMQNLISETGNCDAGELRQREGADGMKKSARHRSGALGRTIKFCTRTLCKSTRAGCCGAVSLCVYWERSLIYSNDSFAVDLYFFSLPRALYTRDPL